MIDEKIIDVDWQETRRFLEEKYFSKIRALSKKYDYPCENIAIDFNWVFGLIEKIEQQPKTDWIPFEVDMPKKEYGTYWIAVKMEGYPCFYYCSAVYTSEHGFRTHDIEAQGKIVAWQPIQLYKKEGVEND